MSQEERRNTRPSSASDGSRTRSASGRESARRSQSQSTRRRRRGMGVGGALLYVVLVIGVSALLAGVAWIMAGDVLALNKEPLEATITLTEEMFNSREVTDEDGNTETVLIAKVGEVARLLREEGIIEYPLVFQLFSAITGGSEKMAPGTYTLDTDMDYRAIISNMSASSASRATVDVTIPEGYTAMQVFERLEENGVCTVEELQDTAANYDFKFSFLQNVIPLGDYRRLEGYLFPDTYTFYVGDDPVNVLNKMILRFDQKFTDEMRQEVADSGHTIHEVVIVASLIEKETTGDDQTSISAVIWNRLASDNYRLLQIDATVQYILPERKEFLTAEDLAIDSPYNTYLYEGLPAGPIANPGESSIRAAMNPEDSNMYFYALGDDGDHHFFRTYQEQRNFIQSQEYYQNANSGE